MNELILSPKFERAYRKFVKRDKRLQKKIDKALTLMQKDLSTPSLRRHKLSGELEGLFACSCGYDCRIVFLLDQAQRIVLVDIGTHDEVY